MAQLTVASLGGKLAAKSVELSADYSVEHLAILMADYLAETMAELKAAC
jgi:hypothetical protein